MRHKIEVWLHQTMRLCYITKLLSDNIVFTDRRTGARGKGPVAQRLQLTDFVDDASANLCSIFDDIAGNASLYIQANGGKLLRA